MDLADALIEYIDAAIAAALAGHGAGDARRWRAEAELRTVLAAREVE